MFKELIAAGGDVSSSFMSLAESLLGGFLSNTGFKQVFSAVTRVIDIADRLKPDVDLKDIKMQTSTYGRLIPEIFGKTRVWGNIIWASPIVTTRTRGSGMPIIDKMSSLIGTPLNSATIRCSFAVALGAGPIDSVDAIYADGKMLDLARTTYTVYYGKEDQLPNSTIQSYIGTSNTPAFRGLAYVVFTDFRLEEYNGRIPNLAFDVSRTKAIRAPGTASPEDLMSGVTLIPGSGHFVYDTKTQYQYQLGSMLGYAPIYRVSRNSVINQNNNAGKTDFMLSLDHLKRDLPNIQWVSIVFTWFCDSTNMGKAKIYPAYEFRVNETEPDKWSVGNTNRDTAKTMLKDSGGNPIYGGTVSDNALLRGIEELKARGYKVCAYPMIFVDMLNKPWRGRITGTEKDMPNFFEGPNGYNNFIMHYASLLKGKVDAFIIGSEFVQITNIKDTAGNWVGVNRFIALASMVRSVMGTGTKLTYAADWSEYHHTEGGWFNMDDLWSCPDIDMIGIDAYFPLTNSARTTYDINEIMKGWVSGEGYDYYYDDSAAKTGQHPIDPKYAWKNIEYFWSNVHVNPDGKQTSWQPKMKKIWFTEYGFPSVDCATNQPNVFYSTDSEESGFPHLSSGRMDIKAQRNAIYATEKQWLKSPMVEQKMVWTWDARPYPFFPSMTEVWKDGPMWKYGHFLNGKIGYSSLTDMITYLCKKAGFRNEQINAESLDIDIGGYVIDSKSSAIKHINMLADIFGFDAYVKDGTIFFHKMEDFNVYTIDISEVIFEKGQTLFGQTKNANPDNVPDEVELLFQNTQDEYRIGVVRASNIPDAKNGARNVLSYSVGIATTVDSASSIANAILLSRCSQGTKYTFALPIVYQNIIPSDIIKLQNGQEVYNIRVTSVTLQNSLSIVVEGNSDDIDLYKIPAREVSMQTPTIIGKISPIVETTYDIIETHPFETEDGLSNPFVYLSVYSLYNNWDGATVYKSEDQGETYQEVGFVGSPNIVGTCMNELRENINTFVPDRVSQIHLHLYSNDAQKLQWVDEEMWMRGANLALIGSEIVSFQSVELRGNNYVVLRDFLRGRFGTEKSTSQHKPGEKFTLLRPENLVKVTFSPKSIGSDVAVLCRSKGDSMDNGTKKTFTLENKSNIDLYPVEFETERTVEGIVIKWNPRSRQELSFFNDTDKKDAANYNLIIYDQAGNPVRKIFVPENGTALYSDQMQMEDFGTTVSKIDVV